MISVGTQSPEFDLRGVAQDGEIRQYSLDALTDGAALLLGIYPYDFSPVCTRQMCDIDDLDWMTFEDGLNVAGIGGDSVYSHRRFSEERDISYPLLSDYSKEVSAAYEVLDDEKDGTRRVPRRSIFLVDPGKRVEYRWVADDNWDEWQRTPLKAVKDRFDELDV